MADMYIDWQPLSDFGGKLESGYSVSGSALTTTYLKGKDTSSFLLTSCEIGLRTITLPIVFFGGNYAAVVSNKNRFDAAAVAKKVELQMPDGYYYTSVLTNTGALTWIGSTVASCTYTFQGIQHGAMEVGEGITKFIICNSTIPKTDCLLRTVATMSDSSYNLNGFVFRDVTSGSVIEVDGIAKRILINGAPAANRCDFLHFPFLVPGVNSISAPDPVDVYYYPTYI